MTFYTHVFGCFHLGATHKSIIKRHLRFISNIIAWNEHAQLFLEGLRVSYLGTALMKTKNPLFFSNDNEYS